MTPARHIAPRIAPWIVPSIVPWLAAVIVMIAVVLMPSGARAHDGHPHDARAMSDVVTSAGPVIAASSLLRHTAPAVTSGAVAVEPARLACACPACMVGAACGHAPSSCCATGLPPSLVPTLTAPVEGARAGMPDEPRLSGIVPEAQAEPPRPIA